MRKVQENFTDKDPDSKRPAGRIRILIQKDPRALVGCLRKKQLLKVSMWKVAFCVIFALEAHKKILGLYLSRKAEKVGQFTFFCFYINKGIFLDRFNLERLPPLFL